MTAESIQARLAALPEPDLPPALWPRIHLARVRQHERRRRIVVGCMAVLAVVALPFVYTRVAAPPAAAPDVFAAAPRAPVHEEPLRVVDRELQHAYERGASEQELQWLWQRRQALARSGSAALPQPIEI
ncbi:hypothetical protein [Pseudoxanthomonas sp. Root630]|uniref:hypothetical protein n=1 Tax=Pseudoxanthomonas sp. Root630 TaxID=1736574 RepID=UPI000702F8FE|nr:hypothetical protein [Pseudoxanthomonas sp. Root630]KRA51720.1 hypothetical protein ASD72_01080 [Pseudoxanthomonas sp. Root630]